MGRLRGDDEHEHVAALQIHASRQLLRRVRADRDPPLRYLPCGGANRVMFQVAQRGRGDSRVAVWCRARGVRPVGAIHESPRYIGALSLPHSWGRGWGVARNAWWRDSARGSGLAPSFHPRIRITSVLGPRLRGDKLTHVAAASVYPLQPRVRRVRADRDPPLQDLLLR